MKELKVNLSSGSYSIFIEENILDKIGTYIKKVYKNKRVYILTDDIVKDLYLEKVIKSLSDYEVEYVVVQNGESSKSLNVYAYVCEELIKKNIRRNELLLALGGGVIGDLCGFVASSLYRGIPYIGIPTTLLSQMDSSIGGKTGIDFYGRKNILGAFKQPAMVLIDPLTLNTLKEDDFISGMGELIKHGAIGNKILLDKLLNNPKINEDIIYESLTVKKKVVEIDEFDQKERMMLNFGHTFGHAIELKFGYKHGIAVGLGMKMALDMGFDLGVTSKEAKEVINKLLDYYKFPQITYKYQDYLKEVIYDKKNLAGVINFIFVTKLGECVIYPIKEGEILNERNN